MGPPPATPDSRYPPRIKCAYVKLEVNGHSLAALVDTGCEIDAFSQKAANLCKLQVHSLHGELVLKMANGATESRVGWAAGVSCWLHGTDSKHVMQRDFYVGAIEHDVILGMPWISEWAARVVAPERMVLATVPTDRRNVHFGILQTNPSTGYVSQTCTEVHTVNGVEAVDDYLGGSGIFTDSLPVMVAALTKSQPTHDTPLPLTADEQKAWDQLQDEFKTVLNNNELPAGRPPAGRLQHHIELKPGSVSSFAPRYRRPPQQEEEIERQVDVLLSKGKVQESTSAFAHNPVLVKRKDGRWRMCINYKPLNEITIKQKFPMPRVDELLDRLQGACVFSSLDFTDAFLQIQMAPEDCHKTAFHTRTRLVEYVCMPFGLVNAPAELQRVVNKDFAGPIREGWLVVYMDDVLVFSKSVAEHLQHLRIALEIIKEKQWFLKAKKCSFFMRFINFLGYLVSQQGVEPDPEKLTALKEWPLPLAKVKDVQSFYGLASYYRSFIPGFAAVAAPLTQLLRKENEFVWGEAQETAARKLIELLTQSPVLSLPDYSQPFILTTDASDYAVGAVLSQKAPGTAKHHIIACYSHRFSPTEQRYPVREKELYAMWWGVKKSKHYLYMRHFIIQTDHQSLMYVNKSLRDFDNPRVIRWLNYLAGYDYTVAYIKGVTNVVADALSRRPDTPTVPASSVVVSLESRLLAKLRRSYPLDSWAKAVIAKLQTGTRVKGYMWEDDLLWARRAKDTRRLYVPASMRTEVLRVHHDHALAGHGGTHSTLEKVRRFFWWPAMRLHVVEYVLSCPACQQHKPRNDLKPGLLQSLPVPDQVWSDISLDFVVALPEVDGQDSILVVVDRLSKHAHFIPCHSTITAAKCAHLFMTHIYKLHGAPRTIVSDRDPKFVCEVWRVFTKCMGSQLCFTTANHPEADGQTERTNRTMLQYLRLYASECPTHWLQYLWCAEFTYNQSVHSSIGCTPNSLAIAYVPLRDPELEIAVGDQLSSAAVEGHAAHLAKAKNCMRKAQEAQATYYNKRRKDVCFEVGDLVWVAREALRGVAEGGKPKKFAEKWQGPFAVRSRINALAYNVDLPAAWRNHRTINIGFLKKFNASAEFPRTLANPKPQVVVNNSFDGIEELLQMRESSRRNKKKREFLVRWNGERQAQWVGEEKLKESIGENEFENILQALNLGAGDKEERDGERVDENS